MQNGKTILEKMMSFRPETGNQRKVQKENPKITRNQQKVESKGAFLPFAKFKLNLCTI